MICNKCLVEKGLCNFRIKKNRKNSYIVKVCIECERIVKRIAESKRYHNLTNEQKLLHHSRAKIASKKRSYRKWHQEWQKQKEQNDVLFRLKRRISTLLRYHLHKNDSVSRIFTFSINELKKHLESQFESWMSWENWGVYDSTSWDDNDSSTWTWQIDHIRPVCNFTYNKYTDKEFAECWSLNNLRPLSSKENIIKGSK